MATSKNATAQELLQFSIASSAYVSKVFKQATHPITKTRTSFLKLNQFLRKTNHGQKQFLR